MTFSVSEGTVTIGATEYSLPAATTTGVPTSQTTECICEIWLDLNLLAAGDLFVLTYYEKVKSGGTQRVVDRIYFGGAQGTPNQALPGIHLKNGWDVTLKKISGTDRSIDFSVRKVT